MRYGDLPGAIYSSLSLMLLPILLLGGCSKQPIAMVNSNISAAALENSEFIQAIDTDSAPSNNDLTRQSYQQVSEILAQKGWQKMAGNRADYILLVTLSDHPSSLKITFDPINADNKASETGDKTGDETGDQSVTHPPEAQIRTKQKCQLHCCSKGKIYQMSIQINEIDSGESIFHSVVREEVCSKKSSPSIVHLAELALRPLLDEPVQIGEQQILLKHKHKH